MNGQLNQQMEADGREPQQEAQESPRRVSHTIAIERENSSYHSIFSSSPDEELAEIVSIGKIEPWSNSEEPKETQYQHSRRQ